MTDGRPSTNDRWVAAVRLRMEGTRPSTPRGDVEDERRLYRELAGPMATAVPMAGGLTAGVRLRTRVVDSRVAEALGSGTDQIVLVAAGYDGRPLRFAGGSARWFEVERRATLTDKARRRAERPPTAGLVVEVALDLPTRAAELGPALEGAGHDRDRPTLFVCEDLATRCTLESMARACSALRSRAAAGSRLVAGFVVAPAPRGTTRALDTALGRVRTRAGAFADYRPGDPEKLMVVTGWSVTRTDSSPGPRWSTGVHTVVLTCAPG